MHYSPQDLQLGADVQAQVDFNAGGQRFGIQYGAPPPPANDEAFKYLLGGAAALVAIYLVRKK